MVMSLAQINDLNMNQPMTLLLDFPFWMISIFIFIIGAVIGSFLNVCVYRIPQHNRLWGQMQSLWDKPSNCPRCSTHILWYDNIPVFGWLKLRGRCRSCKMKISGRYPFIEFLNGALLVLLFWFEVPVGLRATLDESSIFASMGPQVFPGLQGYSPEAFVWMRFFFHAILVETLLVASLIDFDLRIIPEATTTPANIFAVVALLCVPILHLVPVWYQQPGLLRTFGIITPEWLHPFMDGPAVPAWVTAHPYLHGLSVSLAGMLVGGGIVWLVRWAGFLFLREEAMGDGDVYLMAMVGAFLGWQPTVIAFFIAPICALAVVILLAPFVRNRSIPYGPYLSLGTLLTLLFWQPLWTRVGRLFELGVLLVPLALFMGVLFATSLASVYLFKRTFGLLPQPLPEGEWRAAHQHIFFASEKVDRHSCNWKTNDWEGTASGHGSVHEERWKGGSFSGSSFGPNRPW